MIPASLLLCSLHPRPNDLPRIIPHFFNDGDDPWIRLYYEEFLRMESRSRRDILEHFEQKLPFDSPRKKREFLFHFLMKRSNDDVASRAKPKASVLRESLFCGAASFPEKPDRETVTDITARRFGIPTESLLDRAFSDLAMERRISSMPKDLAPERIRLEANLVLAQALIARSASVEIQAQGNIRRLVRQAKLRRLLCHVTQSSAHEPPRLEVSGPLSLFGHTLLYGRAIAELVPLASWCHSFHLRAKCRIRGRDGAFELETGAPLLPSEEPRAYDSRLESRFAKDFMRATSDWNLIREPEPIALPGTPSTLIFPDFLIEHRRNREKRWYLEIVGFWTREYLRKKVERLHAARIQNLIILVDQSLLCDALAELPTRSHVLLFKRTIAPGDVLKILES